ncbi:MAG: hypothetical protein GF335_03305 [Candidatus Moranbacteria bacterium]|nr:hypothetical protein [Candidatus Moranbacteria bacterium]
MDYSTTYEYSSGAEQLDPTAAGAIAATFATFGIIFLILGIALYVYYAICLMKIAKRLNVNNAWMAWIPVANVVLQLQVAKMSPWLALVFVGMFIPVVNFIAGIAMLVINVISWMKIAERLGKPNWWGVLTLVPIVNLIVPGYLAFSQSQSQSANKTSK